MKCLKAPCTQPNCTWCSAKFFRARIRKGLNVVMYFANSTPIAANVHIQHKLLPVVQIQFFLLLPPLSPLLPSLPPSLPFLPLSHPLSLSLSLSLAPSLSPILNNSPSTSTPTVSTTSSCTPPLCPRLDWNIISSAVITVSAILRASVELTFRRRLCRVASSRDSRSVSCCRSAPDTCDCVWG